MFQAVWHYLPPKMKMIPNYLYDLYHLISLLAQVSSNSALKKYVCFTHWTETIFQKWEHLPTIV